MSEEKLEAAAVPQAETTPEHAPVGAELRRARESRQLSVNEVANALKISVRQVEALEADQWERLPGRTFVRGFVRNYARYLRLDGEGLLARLAQNETPETPRIEVPHEVEAELPQPGRGHRRDLFAMGVAVGMVGLAIAAYFLVPEDFWQPSPAPVKVAEEPGMPPADSTAASTAAPAAQASAAPAPAAGVSTAAPEASAAPAPSPANPAPAASTAAPGTSTGTPAAGTSRLHFQFDQPSWVEIKDSTGKVLVSQLNGAGSSRDVDGVPPFTLVVGNATHVKLQYKGKDVPMEQRSKDDVARFNLD